MKIETIERTITPIMTIEEYLDYIAIHDCHLPDKTTEEVWKLFRTSYKEKELARIESEYPININSSYIFAIYENNNVTEFVFDSLKEAQSYFNMKAFW